MTDFSISPGDALAMVTSLVVGGVSYGSMRTRISNCEGDVTELKTAINELKSMDRRLIKLETLAESSTGYLRDLSNSLRWLGQVPNYKPDPNLKGPTP